MLGTGADPLHVPFSPRLRQLRTDVLPNKIGDNFVKYAQSTGRSLVGLLDGRDARLQRLLERNQLFANGYLGEAHELALIPAGYRYALPDEVTLDPGGDALKDRLLPEGGAAMRVVRAPDHHNPEQAFRGPAKALPEERLPDLG
jgi:hypothetical protein